MSPHGFPRGERNEFQRNRRVAEQPRFDVRLGDGRVQSSRAQRQRSSEIGILIEGCVEPHYLLPEARPRLAEQIRRRTLELLWIISRADHDVGSAMATVNVPRFVSEDAARNKCANTGACDYLVIAPSAASSSSEQVSLREGAPETSRHLGACGKHTATFGALPTWGPRCHMEKTRSLGEATPSAKKLECDAMVLSTLKLKRTAPLSACIDDEDVGAARTSERLQVRGAENHPLGQKCFLSAALASMVLSGADAAMRASQSDGATDSGTSKSDSSFR